jgi:hypothetical protein
MAEILVFHIPSPLSENPGSANAIILSDNGHSGYFGKIIEYIVSY